MRTKLIIVVQVVVILVILLAGCKGSSPSPAPFASPASVMSPLPTDEPAPVPVFPTSQPGFATVTGVILQADTRTSIQNALYLGEVLETSDPTQVWVGLDTAVAPQAILDTNTGTFWFHDVPPGKYAPEVHLPLASPILIEDPETGGTMFLTIEGDEYIDLGTILVVVP